MRSAASKEQRSIQEDPSSVPHANRNQEDAPVLGIQGQLHLLQQSTLNRRTAILSGTMPSSEVSDVAGSRQSREDHLVLQGLRHDRLLNAREVATKLGVSERWVRDHTTRRSPKIRAVKLGTLVRYRWADVESFMESLDTFLPSRHQRFGV
jgi:predicted DNA-binding transcriptional regulator AlpA